LEDKNMTNFVVNDNSNRNQYTATASQTVFPYTGQIFDNTDLDVYLTPVGQTPNPAADILVLSSQYTVSIDADGTGNVTLITPASAGDIITINRSVSQTQEVDYSVGGEFTAASINRVIDKLTILIQQVNSAIRDTGLTYDVLDTGLTSGFTTIPKLDANQYWQMNSLGTALFAAELESNSDVNTLRSELASQTSLAPGSGIVGHFSSVNTGTTVSAELEYLLGSESQVGFVMSYIGTTAPSGWILCDDGTIGNASSGATNRANEDTRNLFILLWNSMADAQAPVSTGRGASAEADFLANKTIRLPLILGRVFGVYGSGAGLTTRVNGETFGEEDHTLTKAEIPTHVHEVRETQDAQSNSSGTAPRAGSFGATPVTVNSQDGSADGLAGDPHNNMQPTSFLNAIIKL